MCEKGKYVSFHSMTKIYTEKKMYTLILRKSFCFNSSSSMVIFLLGMLHHTQSLSVQGVHLQMCMAVSVFKEWVIHHCSSCGDIFCLKFNLHLFQRCHKNAYKEQAHDLDLQCLHSPQTTVAFKELYWPAGDNSQDCSSREGKGPFQGTLPTCWRVCWEGSLFSLVHHGVSPSPKSTDGDQHTMRTLWGIQCLLGQCWSPPCLDHLPVKLHGKFPRWQTLGESRVSIPEMAGTSGRCVATWVPLQTQSYREQAAKGSQIHACINCKDEAVQHSNIKIPQLWSCIYLRNRGTQWPVQSIGDKQARSGKSQEQNWVL